MIESFLAEFVKEYGLKEAVLLTKICDLMSRSDNEVVFTIENLEGWFSYFSRKQIRTGVENLLKKKVLKLKDPEEKEFVRTLHYTINEKQFVKYLKILNQGGVSMKKRAIAGAGA
jgi:hypothetical protein